MDAYFYWKFHMHIIWYKYDTIKVTDVSDYCANNSWNESLLNIDMSCVIQIAILDTVTAASE